MTPKQMSEARKLLKWSRERLAARLGVSYDTVRAFETTGRIVAGLDFATAREVLEAAGVEFLPDSGVRLRKPDAGSIPVEDLNASNDE